MRKLLLTILVSALVLGNTIVAQNNTSATDVTGCTFGEQMILHVYNNGIHYVVVNPLGEDGRLELYDDNCNFLGSPMTLPNYGPPGYRSRFSDTEMVYNNNNLCFYAGIDDDEGAVFIYNINTEVLGINNRLSMRGGIGLDFDMVDNKLRVSIGYGSGSSVDIAIAANWGNPIPTPYDSSIGGIQTSIYNLEADMSNPVHFSHLKNSGYDHVMTENGIIGVHGENLLCRLYRLSVQGSGNDRDIFFVEIDLSTGNVVHMEPFDGPANVEISPDGNLYLTLPGYNYTPPGGSSTQVERNVLYKLDSNWNVIEETTQVADDGNNLQEIHITENFVAVQHGGHNFFFTGTDDRQSWMYSFYRKENPDTPQDIQRTYTASGELLERSPSIINRPNYFGKYDFSDSGFSAFGSYDSNGINGGVPSYSDQAGGYLPVQLDGTDLPTASSGEFYSFLYTRTFSFLETFTPQLGLDGVNVYMGKKVVNGVITNSDEFDSVLAIDDADLLLTVGEVYPNPFHSEVRILINIPSNNSTLDISLIDLQGRVINTDRLHSIKNGEFEYLLDVTQFGNAMQPGTYILRIEIQTEGGIQVINKKIIHQLD